MALGKCEHSPKSLTSATQLQLIARYSNMIDTPKLLVSPVSPLQGLIQSNRHDWWDSPTMKSIGYRKLKLSTCLSKSFKIASGYILQIGTVDSNESQWVKTSQHGQNSRFPAEHHKMNPEAQSQSLWQFPSSSPFVSICLENHHSTVDGFEIPHQLVDSYY